MQINKFAHQQTRILVLARDLFMEAFERELEVNCKKFFEYCTEDQRLLFEAAFEDWTIQRLYGSNIEIDEFDDLCEAAESVNIAIERYHPNCFAYDDGNEHREFSRSWRRKAIQGAVRSGMIRQG